LLSSQSGTRSQIVKLSPSVSNPSSTVPSQLLSIRSQISVAPGYVKLSLSSQSGNTPHVVNPSPSTSKSSSINPSQSLSIPSQTSTAPGNIDEFASLQSAVTFSPFVLFVPQIENVSTSTSKSSSKIPSQSLSSPSQLSVTGSTAGV